jgi:hypothetical protein
LSRAPREAALSLLAALLLVALLAIRFDAPWTFIHDDNGAWTQAVASAHLRAGLARTRGQDFLVRRADGGLQPYLHHPPLFPLVTAAAYRLGGRADAVATRLVPAGFHLLGFLGLFLLGGVLFPARPAVRVLALWLYAGVPMSAYFGKMPFNEAMGLCLVIWAALALARYRRRPAAGSLLGSLALWVLAGFTSWTAFTLLLGFFLLSAGEAVAERRPASAAAAWGLGVTGAAAFALVMLQLFWAARGATPGVFAAGEHWGVYRLGWARALDAAARAFDFHRMYFANVPFALFLAWCFLRLRALARRPGELAEAARVLLAGCFGAGLWALLFVRQVALHAYGQFWFLPFEVLAVAELAVDGWRHLAARPRLRAGLAAAALLGTLASTAATLHYRYTTPSSYATRTAAEIAATYYTAP